MKDGTCQSGAESPQSSLQAPSRQMHEYVGVEFSRIGDLA